MIVTPPASLLFGEMPQKLALLHALSGLVMLPIVHEALETHDREARCPHCGEALALGDLAGPCWHCGGDGVSP